MKTPYHRKPVRVLLISPSPNLFGKVSLILKDRLGPRAAVVPFEGHREAERAVREPDSGFELVLLDSAAISSLQNFPQFLAAGDIGLPVLLLLRRGEDALAEAAMEAGYKALLFIDSDSQFRQLLPAMVLRIVTFYRGDRQHHLPETWKDDGFERVVDDLSVAESVLTPRQVPM